MPYCIFTVIWVPFSCLVAVPFSVYPLPLRVEGFYPSFSYHTQFPASRKREGDFPQCHVPKVLCACGHTLPGPESVAESVPRMSPQDTGWLSSLGYCESGKV